jgi:prefoldin subunit 2
MAEKSSENIEDNDPQQILSTYKQMTSECQQIAQKIQELQLERDEHKLVVEQLSKLNEDRKAFRLL